MLVNIFTIIAAAALLAIGIAGCTAPTELEKNWGRSFETAKTSQILNPDGAGHQEPVEGLQGPVVEKILEDHFQKKSDREK